MCGICGKINLNGATIEPELLRRMTSVLSRRGPDGDGTYIHQGHGVAAGLGHRRLSIIDLSDSGRQPMANEDGTLWVVFNGEIYNFQSLRSELEKKGHRFRSRTDTEAILHLYEEEGTRGIHKLTGMFAFALWDERSESLLICRDRVGIKPLVYYRDDRTFLFASEIKSLLQDPSVPKEIDWDALDLYLTFNYIPAPYTIFKNIRKLRPGHILLFQKGSMQEVEYWNLREGETAFDPGEKDPIAQRQLLFNTLDEAVRSHMIADVPIGAFLSGGLDSSIVVGLMSRNSPRPVQTYSIGYEDMPLFDETNYARDVALFNGTDHHEIKLSSQSILSTIPRVLDAFDEPFADSSAIPTFAVSRETARNVKVALSGDGGDELFAGYRMYAGEYWHTFYGALPPFLRNGLIKPLVLALPDSRDSLMADYVRRTKKFIRGAADTFEDRFLGWNEIFSREAREGLLLQTSGSPRDLGKQILIGRLRERDDDLVNRMLYADFKESLPGDMLHKVDAMSMLNSLEVRVPLLDHRVCALAFSLPGHRKIRRGRGKVILLETFRNILPPSLHDRPKWGFEVPIGRWLKRDLKYLMDEYLSPEVISRQAIFHQDAVESLVRDLLANRRDTSWHLWSLIVFQNWYSRHIEGILK